MPSDRRSQEGPVIVVQLLQGDHGVVDLAGEHLGRVVDVRDPSGHARTEVPAGRSEHDDTATGHVLATVVAHALADRRCSGVAHAEPLADLAPQEDLAARRAVPDDVAGDDVVLGGERGERVRMDDDATAGEPLADVVVGVSHQADLDPVRHERAEALAGRPGECDVDRAVRQAGTLPLLGHLVTEQGADGAVDVAHRKVDGHRMAVVDRRPCQLDELLVEGLVEAVILRHALDQGLAVGVLGDRRGSG